MSTLPVAVYEAQLGWAVGLDLRPRQHDAGVIYLTHRQTRQEAEVVAEYIRHLLTPNTFEHMAADKLFAAWLGV